MLIHNNLLVYYVNNNLINMLLHNIKISIINKVNNFDIINEQKKDVLKFYILLKYNFFKKKFIKSSFK